MALNRRFGGKERCFVFEKLAKLKQQGRGEEYIQEFEGLVMEIKLKRTWRPINKIKKR